MRSDENQRPGGNTYFVTLIDDKSCYTAIYFMEGKDKVFDKFLEYEAMVEDLTGEKIKVLRTNNAGKYLPKTLPPGLHVNICPKLTVPGTRKQN